MNFSFCIIARNEEKTLPRLIASLKSFQEQGGAVVLVDTGSTDYTVQLAREAGFLVEEVGERFLSTINGSLAQEINDRFVISHEGQIVQEGERYFDFAAARNYAASLCPTDMVSCIDCDEEITVMDLEKINQLIEAGYTQFEYSFVFAHRDDGSSALEFTQSKFYDRRTIQWVGMVHEVLEGNGKRIFLEQDTFKIEHWQNHETNRHSYLTGLAVDCYLHPEKDRNSHYFARELFWADKPYSALREFQRHVDMNKWPAERAQSLIFIGDICGQLNKPAEQMMAYSEAFMTDSTRREALIKLARFYQHNNNPLAANAYAEAALTIPWHAFYANNKNHYEHEPHEILYWAKGWLGDIEGAKEHIQQALAYQPENPAYLSDLHTYYS